MFHHVKELQYNVRVSRPDVRFAQLLLEQWGGPNGELKAAMQYFAQALGWRIPLPEKYDMLIGIAVPQRVWAACQEWISRMNRSWNLVTSSRMHVGKLTSRTSS